MKKNVFQISTTSMYIYRVGVKLRKFTTFKTSNSLAWPINDSASSQNLQEKKINAAFLALKIEKTSREHDQRRL